MMQRETQRGVAAQAPPVEQTEQIVESGAGVERRERIVTDGAGDSHRERSVRDVASEQQQQLFRVSQLVWLCVGIVEVLIGARVLLKLIAANPDNAFARFVYDAAAVFLSPFFGLTSSPAARGSVLEISSLIAMAAYLVLGWGVLRVVQLLFNRSMTRSISTYDRSRS